MADRMIVTRQDANSIREDIEAVYDGWFADEASIDWEYFLDRLEGRGYDLGGSMTTPAIYRIKQIVRELRKQA